MRGEPCPFQLESLTILPSTPFKIILLKMSTTKRNINRDRVSPCLIPLEAQVLPLGFPVDIPEASPYPSSPFGTKSLLRHYLVFKLPQASKSDANFRSTEEGGIGISFSHS